jgi:NADPH2:quinone reductase
MSQRIVAAAYGGPEVLALVDYDVPPPGPGEVVIAVRAAGVNPVDYKFYGGAYGTDPAKLPRPVGLEASGVVSAVGEGAEGPVGPVSVGDEVIVYPASGTFATDVLVRASSVVPKPPGLGFEEAAGLFLTGVTAAHALAASGAAAGETVLLHAAGGGVGSMVLQLAAARGVKVIGTAGERNHAYVRSLGGTPVTHGPGLADRVRGLAPDGIDAAIDAVGSDEAIDASLELVADPARIVSIAAFGRGDDGITLIGGGPGADPGTELRDAARLDLAKRAGSGELRVTVARTYPLAEAPDALRDIQAGRTRGKLIVVP